MKERNITVMWRPYQSTQHDRKTAIRIVLAAWGTSTLNHIQTHLIFLQLMSRRRKAFIICTRSVPIFYFFQKFFSDQYHDLLYLVDFT